MTINDQPFDGKPGDAILTRGGMGMGDVKLAFFTGFALGLTFGVNALLLTAIGGGIIAVVLIVLRLRNRHDPIPYAPFIAPTEVPLTTFGHGARWRRANSPNR